MITHSTAQRYGIWSRSDSDLVSEQSDRLASRGRRDHFEILYGHILPTSAFLFDSRTVVEGLTTASLLTISTITVLESGVGPDSELVPAMLRLKASCSTTMTNQLDPHYPWTVRNSPSVLVSGSSNSLMTAPTSPDVSCVWSEGVKAHTRKYASARKVHSVSFGSPIFPCDFNAAPRANFATGPQTDCSAQLFAKVQAWSYAASHSSLYLAGSA